jgi:hypothetical protein
MSKRDELRESIIKQLQINPRLVEHAIVKLYERQTIDEQNSSETKHDNGMGFSSNTARLGTYYAQYILKGNRLTGKHIDNARRIAVRHVRQLVELAEKKAKR